MCAGDSKVAPLLTVASPVEARDLADRRAVSVLIFGDAGKSDTLATVARGMARACAAGCDLALSLGDNVYPRGPIGVSQRLRDAHFDRPLRPLGPLDVWTVLGNHGYRGCPERQVAWTAIQPSSVDGPIWRLPSRHYAVPRLPAWLHLVAIDTEYLIRTAGDVAFDQRRNRARYLATLEHQLCADEGWYIAFGHHPLLSTGHHADDRALVGLRADLGPILERCDVPLYLAGHDHDQELLVRDRFTQVVQGAASKLRPQLNAGHHTHGGDRSWFFERLGFAIATFTEQVVTVTFFGADGDPLALPGGDAIARWRLARGHAARLHPESAPTVGPPVRPRVESQPK